MTPAERTIQTSIRWNVATDGPKDGEPVLLLHGFPEIWRSWKKQMGPLGASGYRAYAADLPGYGLTEAPRSYALADLAEHVVDLARALAPSGVHLVGHDWGGMIGHAATARDPEAFRSLVAVAAPHPDAIPRALTDPVQVLKSWYVGVFLVPGVDRLLGARDAMLAKRIFGGPTSDLWDAAHVSRAIAYYRANLGPASVARPRIGRIAPPGMVVHATKDAHIGLRLMKQTAEQFDDLRGFHLIECGHFVHRWCADRFNPLLLGFLDSVRS